MITTYLTIGVVFAILVLFIVFSGGYAEFEIKYSGKQTSTAQKIIGVISTVVTWPLFVFGFIAFILGHSGDDDE